MEHTILSVSRIDESRIHFVLHRSGAQLLRPTVVEGQTELDPGGLAQLVDALDSFANCIRGRSEDEPRLRNLGEVLYRLVIPENIAAAIRDDDQPIAITTNLPQIPWELLHDGNEFVALRRPLSRMLMVQQMGSLLAPEGAQPLRPSSLIIADPGDRFPGAAMEGEALHEVFSSFGDCDLLLGRDATFANVSTALVRRPYSVVHFCGHIEHDVAQSTTRIPLAGGGAVTPRTVRKMFKGRPLVFLNGCYSDHAPLDQDDASHVTSFARAFLVGNGGGAACAVIGTMWPIPDEPKEAAREMAVELYTALLSDVPVGEALRLSRRAAQGNQRGPMHWGPYVLYGNPCLRILSRDHAAGEAESAGERPQRTTVGAAPAQQPLADRSERGAALDTAAREVLHLAMEERSSRAHEFLGTIHLLIGFCTSESALRESPLEQLLRSHRIDPAQVADAARSVALRTAEETSDRFAISKGAWSALQLGRHNAERAGREDVTAADLFVGLFMSRRSMAAAVLKRAGVDDDGLRAAVEEVAYSDFRFDEDARMALAHAVQCARGAGLPFLGTPHLLVGHLRTGVLSVVTFVREHGVQPERLSRRLLRGMGQGDTAPPNGQGAEPLVPTQRCRGVLQRAAALATEEHAAEIGTKHILQAILESGDGLSNDVLRESAVDPSAMLDRLRRA